MPFLYNYLPQFYIVSYIPYNHITCGPQMNYLVISTVTKFVDENDQQSKLYG